MLGLKQRFDENSQANFLYDLKQPSITPEKLYLYNNFGICSQQRYIAIGEGLARVKAHFVNSIGAGSTQIIETSFAEIASYDSLVIKQPNYVNFFADL